MHLNFVLALAALSTITSAFGPNFNARDLYQRAAYPDEDFLSELSTRDLYERDLYERDLHERDLDDYDLYKRDTDLYGRNVQENRRRSLSRREGYPCPHCGMVLPSGSALKGHFQVAHTTASGQIKRPIE